MTGCEVDVSGQAAGVGDVSLQANPIVTSNDKPKPRMNFTFRLLVIRHLTSFFEDLKAGHRRDHSFEP
jgi:hypothetical protein